MGLFRIESKWCLSSAGTENFEGTEKKKKTESSLSTTIMEATDGCFWWMILLLLNGPVSGSVPTLRSVRCGFFRVAGATGVSPNGGVQDGPESGLDKGPFLKRKGGEWLNKSTKVFGYTPQNLPKRP